MFFFRHPKRVVDPRAVAMQVVKQSVSGAIDKHLLIVEPNHASKAEMPSSKPDKNAL